MNKLIAILEADWGTDDAFIFHNEKDLRDHYSEYYVEIIADTLILEKNGIKTYGKILWGKQL